MAKYRITFQATELTSVIEADDVATAGSQSVQFMDKQGRTTAIYGGVSSVVLLPEIAEGNGDDLSIRNTCGEQIPAPGPFGSPS